MTAGIPGRSYPKGTRVVVIGDDDRLMPDGKLMSDVNLQGNSGNFPVDVGIRLDDGRMINGRDYCWLPRRK